MLISCRTGVLTAKARGELRDCLLAAVRRNDPNVREHLGTKTLPEPFLPDPLKRHVRRVAEIAVAAGERLLSEPLEMSFADLVYRPAGLPADRHTDDEAQPQRRITAVLPLHDIEPRMGGQTVVELGGRDLEYGFAAGRMAIFPSSAVHWVRAPGEDRCALLLWLKSRERAGAGEAR